MHNVKLIRMQSGEDILASMCEEENSDMIQLNEPMRLVFRRMPTGQTVMMMMPWLPVELIKVNSANIYYTDIVTIVEPREEMIRYYDKVIEKLSKDMEESDKKINELLEDHDDSDEENEEEVYQEILQHINEIKNKKLH
jgi:hypothetical protein